MNCQSSQPSLLASLKASIRDLAHLHKVYAPSDEVLWAYFNTRVLMNQPVEVDDFMLNVVLIEGRH